MTKETLLSEKWKEMDFYIYCINSNYVPNKYHFPFSFSRTYENFVKW